MLGNRQFMDKDYWEMVQKPSTIKDPLFSNVPYYQKEGAFFLHYSMSKALEIKYCELAATDPIYTKKNI